jgi:hypothetical protein
VGFVLLNMTTALSLSMCSALPEITNALVPSASSGLPEITTALAPSACFVPIALSMNA